MQSLLSTPEPKDPQDAEVANMLLKTPKEFERVARDWAVIYAGAPMSDDNAGGYSVDDVHIGDEDNLAKSVYVSIISHSTFADTHQI